MSGGRREVDVSDSEDRAARFVGQAAYFPAMGQDDLLDHRQAEAGPFQMGGKIGFEDLGAVLGRNARAVVANLENEPARILFGGGHLDVAAPFDGLDGIDQEIEERLSKQWFIGLDGRQGIGDAEANALLLEVISQCPDHFADDPRPIRGRVDDHDVRAGGSN